MEFFMSYPNKLASHLLHPICCLSPRQHFFATTHKNWGQWTVRSSLISEWHFCSTMGTAEGGSPLSSSDSPPGVETISKLVQGWSGSQYSQLALPGGTFPSYTKELSDLRDLSLLTALRKNRTSATWVWGGWEPCIPDCIHWE